ncbi:hypothetical protein NDU88_012195 [Pleurodeles waltl]|uniref:Uncharacterized protein n=1 Tax=Pleurodeles waltl TaxID=8319 RepID=A0AAV7R271_PLEWA|nr:hypothetical protein NDU88_012195 [Pleurodeles waltl]
MRGAEEEEKRGRGSGPGMELPGPVVEIAVRRRWGPKRETRLSGRRTEAGLGDPVMEPMRVELLAAIQGSREALKGKIESVVIKVNLLRGRLPEDYTSKVQRSRKGFLEVKAKLHLLNILYMLLYPAWLKVLHGGKSYFFEMPDDEWKWLELSDKVPHGGERPRRKEDARRGRDSNRRPQKSAGQLELLPSVGASQTRVKIQEDGTIWR